MPPGGNTFHFYVSVQSKQSKRVQQAQGHVVTRAKQAQMRTCSKTKHMRHHIMFVCEANYLCSNAWQGMTLQCFPGALNYCIHAILSWILHENAPYKSSLGRQAFVVKINTGITIRGTAAEVWKP